MLIGNKVTFRGLEESDLPQMREWRNREDFRKYFREYRELNAVDQKTWFDSQGVKNDKTIMFAILDSNTQEFIGVCGLCYINWVYRHADLSLYIGKDNLYIDTDRDGYAWASLDLLFEYAFNRLNLHKVWTEIYSFDPKKNKLLPDYGFSNDAILRDNYFYDGKYMDSIIYTILADEWRSSHAQ